MTGYVGTIRTETSYLVALLAGYLARGLFLDLGGDDLRYRFTAGALVFGAVAIVAYLLIDRFTSRTGRSST